MKIPKNQELGSESQSLSEKSILTKSAILEAIRAGIVSAIEVKEAMGLSEEVGHAIALLWLYHFGSNISMIFYQILLQKDEGDENRSDGDSFENVRFQ